MRFSFIKMAKLKKTNRAQQWTSTFSSTLISKVFFNEFIFKNSSIRVLSLEPNQHVVRWNKTTKFNLKQKKIWQMQFKWHYFIYSFLIYNWILIKFKIFLLWIYFKNSWVWNSFFQAQIPKHSYIKIDLLDMQNYFRYQVLLSEKLCIKSEKSHNNKLTSKGKQVYFSHPIERYLFLFPEKT